ncbi:MAG TPA: ATP synthase subunit I [Gammaproteobacteria bacterium]
MAHRERSLIAVIGIQLLLVLVAVGAASLLRGGAAMPAAVYGGGMALLNLLLLDWRARRANRAGALSARQSLGVLYLSALERFAAVALLFALGMGPLHLDPLPLLLGFMAGLVALPLRTRPGHR